MGCKGEVLFLKPKNIGRYFLVICCCVFHVFWGGICNLKLYTLKILTENALLSNVYEYMLTLGTNCKCPLQDLEMNFILLLNIKSMEL